MLAACGRAAGALLEHSCFVSPKRNPGCALRGCSVGDLVLWKDGVDDGETLLVSTEMLP